MAHINALMCGLLGFASQPKVEHVGYSHVKHAQSDFFVLLLCLVEELKACRRFAILHTLQRTVGSVEGSVPFCEASQLEQVAA